MTPENFAKEFYKEKKKSVDLYFDFEKRTGVSELIKSLNLDDKGNERIRQIINGILTDTLYTILLGIDGATTIGENQELYKLLDEKGKEITGGEIEVEAWEYFQNNKYEIENGYSDFIAELEYKSEGGRKTPAISGYRPQIKFEFDETQTSGKQRFIDRKFVFPGDKVNAEINILSVDHFANKLEEGMKFEFREGSVVIGKGKILTIVNEKLKKEASR